MARSGRRYFGFEDWSIYLGFYRTDHGPGMRIHACSDFSHFTAQLNIAVASLNDWKVLLEFTCLRRSRSSRKVEIDISSRDKPFVPLGRYSAPPNLLHIYASALSKLLKNPYHLL